MKALILNCGSSSIKISIYDNDEQLLHSGSVSNLHTGHPSAIWDGNTLACSHHLNFESGLELIFDQLNDKNIDRIGHRFVHGGDLFLKTTHLTPDIIEQLESLNDLAPLHNPACLAGIKQAMDFFSCPQYAIFDTAFYQDLPLLASLYALPLDLMEKWKIRRYGFHGISHEYLWNAYCAKAKTDQHKIITLHLGNGCSITAINKGKPIETSMGFSPNEGLVMGTRSGDLDPTIIPYLMKREKLSLDKTMDLINDASGLKGLSGTTEDMAVLEQKYSSDNKARNAIDLFCYRAAKYTAAYLAILEGADALVFSGGIGENSLFIRNHICKRLRWLGVHPSEYGNNGIPSYVIPTNENLQIARELFT